MAYSGLGTGTNIDPFQITTPAQFNEMSGYAESYFLMMNDLDWVGINIFAITAFASHLDGGGFTLNNLPVGSFCFDTLAGSSLTNTTFRFNRKSTGTYQYYFFSFITKTSVSITNLKIIVTDIAFFYQIDYMSYWRATCTISNIILEGNIQGGFTGYIYCAIDHVKMLRYKDYSGSASIGGSFVGKLYGPMSNCQLISPYLTLDLGLYYRGALLVGELHAGGSITKSFVKSNMVLKGAVGANVVHGMVGIGSADEIIQDSYFIGNISIDGGEITDTASGNDGKSGFAISGHSAQKVYRCYYSGDINTPLNDNRPVLVKEYNTVSNYVQNCYYDKTKLVSITPKDIAAQQIGLTSAEMAVTTNFTGWDFATVWDMVNGNPVLRDNPVYAFEGKMRIMSSPSGYRVSGTEIKIVLAAGQFDGSIFGFDLEFGGTVVYNAENILINNITVPELDGVYTIKPYWLDAGVKNYTTELSYMHYSQDSALEIVDVETDMKVELSDGLDANYVHGSCIFGDYVFGSARSKFGLAQTGTITRAPLSDITQFVNTPIYYTGEGIGTFQNMEQIVVCGDYLYTLGNTQDGGQCDYLVQFNPLTLDYKIFKLHSDSARTQPIITDGTFLYLYNCDTSGNVFIQKVDPAEFIGAFPKFNTDANFPYNVLATYDASSQGGHILGGYSSLGKGWVHSAVVDENNIYVSFTTANGVYTDKNGYSASLDLTLHELQVINKSDMTPAGWCYIPKSTDDMCQTNTHLFFGVEIQPNPDPRTYGYGWGNYAVRKSDLRLTSLTRLHSTEPINNGFSSYASLIFGNYLLDSKTNKYTYILDITNVDNWTPSEQIGKYTLKCYNFYYLGVKISKTPNEFLLSEAGKFYAFLWGGSIYLSGLMQTDLPGLSFFSAPTVNTLAYSVTGIDVTLSGYLLNQGGGAIISKGFHYGTLSTELNSTITSTETTLEFHGILSGLPSGTYYYQAFAINSIGESSSEIKSFDIGIIPCYVGSSHVQAIYLGSVKINNVI